MTRLLYASTLILLAGAAGLVVLGVRGGTGPVPAHGAAAGQLPPTVEMVPDRHDFGDMPRSTVATATFAIAVTIHWLRPPRG